MCKFAMRLGKINDTNAISWSRYSMCPTRYAIVWIRWLSSTGSSGDPKKIGYHLRTCSAVLMCVKIRSRWKINRRFSQLCFHYKKEIVNNQIDTIHLAVPSTAQRAGWALITAVNRFSNHRHSLHSSTVGWESRYLFYKLQNLNNSLCTNDPKCES